MSESRRRHTTYEVRESDHPFLVERTPEVRPPKPKYKSTKLSLRSKLYNLFNPRRHRKTIIIQETRRGRTVRRRIERSRSPSLSLSPVRPRRRRPRSVTPPPVAKPSYITRSPTPSPSPPPKRRVRIRTPSPDQIRPESSRTPRTTMSPPNLTKPGTFVPLPKVLPKTNESKKAKNSDTSSDSDYNVQTFASGKSHGRKKGKYVRDPHGAYEHVVSDPLHSPKAVKRLSDPNRIPRTVDDDLAFLEGKVANLHVRDRAKDAEIDRLRREVQELRVKSSQIQAHEDRIALDRHRRKIRDKEHELQELEEALRQRDEANRGALRPVSRGKPVIHQRGPSLDAIREAQMDAQNQGRRDGR